MRKIPFILLIVQLLLISTSCQKYDQRLDITDVKQSQLLVLQKQPNQKNIVSMGLRCYGKMVGEAQLVLMLNGAPYKTANMKGKVDFTWGGDWYSDSMELRYQPSNVTSGQLIIDYTFSEL